MFKIIFRTIGFVIKLILILGILLYPWVMYDENLILFYFEKISLYIDTIKETNLIENIYHFLD